MSALLQVATRVSGLPVLVGTAAPEYASGGIPYDNGVLAIDTTSAISYWHQGIPFTGNGRIAASLDSPSYFNSGGEPIDVNGRLATSGSAIDHFSSGIPYISTSSVAATAQ